MDGGPETIFFFTTFGNFIPTLGFVRGDYPSLPYLRPKLTDKVGAVCYRMILFSKQSGHGLARGLVIGRN